MKQIMRISIRRLGETLYIGDDVQVTIFAIKGDEVRLGIEAPKSVPIRRGELTIKKHCANPHRWSLVGEKDVSDLG
jgi:carbon storage regulator